MESKDLSDLLKILKIPRADWDYVLIGDGSATSWGSGLAAGWGCLEIENGTYNRVVHYGGANRGTNVLSELMAYLYPMWEICERDSRRTDHMGFSRVHIITDAENLKNYWNNTYKRKKLKSAWSAVECLSRLGFIIQFHWIPRDSVDANRLCHDLANSARKVLKLPQHISQAVSRRGVESEYDVTPS